VLLPDNALGDLATGLDYTWSNVDPELNAIFDQFLALIGFGPFPM
jgi:hypothetical protein